MGDMVVMVMAMAMAREKPSQLLKLRLLLKPMLNQVIIIMATLTDMAMDMDMARGRLPPDIIIMVMDMVDMAMDTDMERGRLMLPLAIIIMVMDMVDMDMVMDTMVKQYLFISFSKFCCIHWNLLESSQQKHRPLFKKNKNSFFEIKRTKL